mgnify:FL=1|tara:strand:- start:27 stop:617 length:591 start_codon:yes stop_codon:yes gene_type:complete
MYLEVGDKMKKLLLFLCVFLLSCEDDRIEIPAEENIQMWVNGTEIIAREYYESITTYGASSVQEDGSVKKIFVLHFQREDGRVTPEKEHYALIMYDNNASVLEQPIDEKLYLGGTQVDSLLLQTTSGRITLEIVGLSDYTEFAQASIDKYEDGKVSGMADGYFFNPYRNEMQHGIIIFDNLEVGSDPEATFYQGVY